MDGVRSACWAACRRILVVNMVKEVVVVVVMVVCGCSGICVRVVQVRYQSRLVPFYSSSRRWLSSTSRDAVLIIGSSGVEIRQIVRLGVGTARARRIGSKSGGVDLGRWEEQGRRGALS